MNVCEPPDAVILLGRSGYSGAPKQQLERLVEAARQTQRYRLVCSALVDQGDPSLPKALDACAASGARRAIVLPIFIPGDRNLQIWLAKVVRRWQARHGATGIAVVLAAGLGDHAALDVALVAALADAENDRDLRDDPPRNWEHDPDGWSVLPAHEQHILTCRGPRCTALGAGDCWASLAQSLGAHGLRGADERVLVAQTGCLYPCNHGPVLVVYPAGVWYGNLTPARVEQIVSEHLMAGRIVGDLRIVPGAPLIENDAAEED